jgi:hypothetical protein
MGRRVGFSLLALSIWSRNLERGLVLTNLVAYFRWMGNMRWLFEHFDCTLWRIAMDKLVAVLRLPKEGLIFLLLPAE